MNVRNWWQLLNSISVTASEYLKLHHCYQWKKIALPMHLAKVSAPWEEMKCKVSCFSGGIIGSRIQLSWHGWRALEILVKWTVYWRDYIVMENKELSFLMAWKKKMFKWSNGSPVFFTPKDLFITIKPHSELPGLHWISNLLWSLLEDLGKENLPSFYH